MNTSTFEHLTNIRAKVDTMTRFGLSIPPEVDQALAAVDKVLVDDIKAKAMDVANKSQDEVAKLSSLAVQAGVK